MRFPLGPLSAQRNCQTSGPRFRPLLIRLPCCILASGVRSCDAEEFLRNATGNKDAWRARSELLCGGNAQAYCQKGAGPYSSNLIACNTCHSLSNELRERGVALLENGQ